MVRSDVPTSMSAQFTYTAASAPIYVGVDIRRLHPLTSHCIAGMRPAPALHARAHYGLTARI
jgi:hypothetical protein